MPLSTTINQSGAVRCNCSHILGCSGKKVGCPSGQEPVRKTGYAGSNPAPTSKVLILKLIDMVTSILLIGLPITAKMREKMNESGKEFFTRDEVIEMLTDSVYQFSKDIKKIQEAREKDSEVKLEEKEN